jgi:MFS family permease
MSGWVHATAAGLGQGVAGGGHWSEERQRAVQRRTMGTLVLAQGLGGLGITIGIAVAAILAEELSGSEKLAGLAQTMQVLGAAFASFLLAHLMGTQGRRRGLTLGYVIGAAGGAVCVVAGVSGSFPLLLLGAALLGSTTATNQLSRYAATDLARPEHRARSLSLVVWATTIGAVAGPNLVGRAGDLASGWGLPALTGPFLVGLVGIALAAAVVGVSMRPDPLLVAREVAAAEGRATAPPGSRGTKWRRVVQVVRESPGVSAGVVTLALAHAAMVSVMVMTPLHMHHGGSTLEIIGIVVSGHVLGMFAFAPVVGWAADRFGRAPVMTAGALVLLVSLGLAGTSPSGTSWTIAVGLFLLGLGWSFSTVAASTLLTESAPLDARTDVQGAADLVMGLAAAAGGALAGLIVGSLGFGALTAFAAVLAAGIATAAEFARRATRRGGAQTDEHLAV